MKRLICCILAATALALSVMAAPKYPYRNAALPVEQRVEDLLSRMTTQEKVGQLVCLLGWDSYVIEGKKVTTSAAFRQQVDEQHVGMYWATFRADPWTQKTLDNGLNPALATQAANAMQRYAVDSTRLGIPLLLAEEAPHGHMAIGTTVFPTGLGMAATWSQPLLQRVGEVIGKEIRLQGGHISYGPVLDLSRDPRWSRVEETLGEDPCLTGCLGAAMVTGMGGDDLQKPYATAATLKHFIAYGTTEGGINGARSVVTPRELQQMFLPPFHRTLKAGAWSVMTAYNTIDGVPCSANRALLTDVLRGEWGMDRSVVVSDLYSIDGMYGTHHTVASKLDAAIASLEAGVDVDLGGNCFAQLVKAVENGQINSHALDNAVRRVLRLKFEMGLFESPYVDSNKASRQVHDAQAVTLAREVAQASVTLLKNDGTLPLRHDLRVAVVGPNADNVYNQLGDYTAPQPEGKVVTTWKGIAQKLPANHCTYIKGCAVRDTTQSDIAGAVAAAQQADVVVAVVGGSSARDFKTSYEQTGAATATKTVSDMESGEGFDRATLDLMGNQNELLHALKQTGKPLVVVYIEGRPLAKCWADDHANAVLTAYYPGEQGGNAIADVLFGDYNPAGRLPVTVPHHVGQLPVYYNRPMATLHDYVEMTASPLYPFGYGLSYTTFAYSNLSIARTADGGYDVTFAITNTGSLPGDEVAQLYVRDPVASVAQPERQLKAFERVTLEAGQTRTVSLHLDTEDLALVNTEMQWTVEPGTFEILIGASSSDIRLKGTISVP